MDYEPGPFASSNVEAPARTLPRPRFGDDVAAVSAAALMVRGAIDTARDRVGRLDPADFADETHTRLLPLEEDIELTARVADGLANEQLWRNAETLLGDLDTFVAVLPDVAEPEPGVPAEQAPVPTDEPEPAPTPAPPPEV